MRCTPESHRTGSCFVLILLSLLLVPHVLSARTWHVNPAGTGDVPTIQTAIDSATDGDLILLSAGRYTWANQGGGSIYGMLFVPRGTNNFTIRGESGAAATILDAQNQSRVLYIQGYNSVLLEGLTFTGGNAPSTGYYNGGGVATHLSSDVIRDCVFEFNNASGGGGLWVGGVSQFTMERCTFRRNTAQNGAAMLFINSNTLSTIDGCRIDYNQAVTRGGGIYGVSNRLAITNTVFSRNEAGSEGGALYLREMWPSTVGNCTLVLNIAPIGVGLSLVQSPSVMLERSIVAFNSGPAFTSAASSVLTSMCNNVYNNSSNALPAGSIDGGGNFSDNPVFCDVVTSLNFTLHSSSPCADGNHPDGASCGLIGALDVNCGGVRTEVTTWGQVKALYR